MAVMSKRKKGWRKLLVHGMANISNVKRRKMKSETYAIEKNAKIR